jgi:hypothetical protein
MYPTIALIQVVMLIFILIFYTDMDPKSSEGVSSAVKYNQFSGYMVLAMFAHVASMVWERYIVIYTLKSK